MVAVSASMTGVLMIVAASMRFVMHVSRRLPCRVDFIDEIGVGLVGDQAQSDQQREQKRAHSIVTHVKPAAGE